MNGLFSIIALITVNEAYYSYASWLRDVVPISFVAKRTELILHPIVRKVGFVLVCFSNDFRPGV